MLTGASSALLKQRSICRCIAHAFTEQMLGHVFHEPRMLRNVDVAYTHTHTLSIPGQWGALLVFLKRQSKLTAANSINELFIFCQVKNTQTCIFFGKKKTTKSAS